MLADASPAPWAVRASRQVYRNPWLRVREDRLLRPDGSSGTYGVVEIGDAVSVVALAKDSLCLVRQYRHAWGRDVWEAPCGGVEPGETPLAAARRELREEAGIGARWWRKAGIIRTNDPVANTFHLFLARGLSFGPAARDGSEAGMVSRMWPFKDIKRAVADGRITDDMTLACIFKCLLLAKINL
jgi:8-oxo-dGDP phosphatase